MFLKWGMRRLGEMTTFTALRKRGGRTQCLTVNFPYGSFQSLCVHLCGRLATTEILIPVYLSARSLLLGMARNWG